MVGNVVGEPGIDSCLPLQTRGTRRSFELNLTLCSASEKTLSPIGDGMTLIGGGTHPVKPLDSRKTALDGGGSGVSATGDRFAPSDHHLTCV